MNLKLEIRQVLGSTTSDKDVHAQALLDLLDKAQNKEDKIDLLEIVLTERDTVDKHPQVLKNKGMDTATYQECAKLLGDMVRNYARNAFFSTSNSHDFAVEILRFLEFQASPPHKCFCLASILYDTHIVPYHNLPGKPTKILFDEYKHLLLANKDKADLISYLVKLPFYDWIEASSVVLQVIDDAKDPKLRIALLSFFMTQKVSASEDKNE